jgi:hypothetical protein
MSTWSNSKYSITSPLHAAKYLSLYIYIDMVDVQRLSPDGRVKPQAYGGTKILALQDKMRDDK